MTAKKAATRKRAAKKRPAKKRTTRKRAPRKKGTTRPKRSRPEGATVGRPAIEWDDAELVTLRGEGLSWESVARILGVSTTALHDHKRDNEALQFEAERAFAETWPRGTLRAARTGIQNGNTRLIELSLYNHCDWSPPAKVVQVSGNLGLDVNDPEVDALIDEKLAELFRKKEAAA